MTTLPPDFGTPGRHTPKRDAKTKARKSIAYQTALFKRRSLHPFKFEFSDKIEEQTDQVAEILNNISIGNFDDEMEAVAKNDSDDLLSDDENIEDKENIEVLPEDLESVENEKNNSSDTIILSQKLDNNDLEKNESENKPESPNNVNRPNTAIPDTKNSVKPPVPMKSKAYTPRIFSSKPKHAYSKPQNTPNSAFRNQIRPSTTPGRLKFDLAASLKKKPSWKMHTGKLKPLGSYTPDARISIEREQKMENNRIEARKEALGKFKRKTVFFDKIREEKFDFKSETTSNIGGSSKLLSDVGQVKNVLGPKTIIPEPKNNIPDSNIPDSKQKTASVTNDETKII